MAKKQTKQDNPPVTSYEFEKLILNGLKKLGFKTPKRDKKTSIITELGGVALDLLVKSQQKKIVVTWVSGHNGKPVFKYARMPSRFVVQEVVDQLADQIRILQAMQEKLAEIRAKRADLQLVCEDIMDDFAMTDSHPARIAPTSHGEGYQLVFQLLDEPTARALLEAYRSYCDHLAAVTASTPEPVQPEPQRPSPQSNGQQEHPAEQPSTTTETTSAPEPEEVDAYTMGMEAAEAGKFTVDNPFPPDTDECKDWADGFEALVRADQS